MYAVRNVSLVRETSSAAVYLVVGDTKFWITSPAEFDALGFEWSRVLIVDDGFLDGFVERRLQAPPLTRPSDVFVDCVPPPFAVGGGWGPTGLGEIYLNCQSSDNIIRRDVLVAGWLTRFHVNDTGTYGVEDVWYDLVLDAVFLERMYGQTGLSSALVGAVLPGNPRGNTPKPFADGPAITFNSWLALGQSGKAEVHGAQVHGELNAWHTALSGSLWTGHFAGRGPAPEHWVAPLVNQDEDAWFPFRPEDPEGVGRRLWDNDFVANWGGEHDYVVMRGTLWQDHLHDPEGAWHALVPEHAGWLEVHPVDWLVRVKGPSQNLRLTTECTSLCTDTRFPFALLSSKWRTASWGMNEIVPDFRPVLASGRPGRVELRSFERTTDVRFTFEPSVFRTEIRSATAAQVGVNVRRLGQTPGQFKGCWLVGWRVLDPGDIPWVDDELPRGAQALADGESWNWISTGPAPFTGGPAHQSAGANGMHQHYFLNATVPLVVEPGDVFFAMVYLDHEQPPAEVMLQWHSGDWEHRAYWGDDRIAWGQPGSEARRPMGRLPFTDEWVRLEVPASLVGLEGRSIDGMAFTLWDGKATWDYAGIRRNAEEPPGVPAEDDWPLPPPPHESPFLEP